MQKQSLKIFFTDFWEDFDMNNNIFINSLMYDFNVEVTSDNPDILFYSWLGDNFKYFDCIRIYYTPEVLKPKYRDCDFSLSFEYWEDKRNLRLPNYLLYNYKIKQFDKTKIDPCKELGKKPGFCCMVISNPNSRKRINFFEKLSKYKKVDSGGRVLNNIGGAIEDKHGFVSKYKFNIAFENCSSPGYTTEKIVQSMIANTIPIYWGDPRIHFEFNRNSFFNYNDYGSEDNLIEDIILHDKNPEKYVEKFKQSWFINDFPNQYFDLQRLRYFLYNIIKQKNCYIPIAKNKYKKYIYYPLGAKVNTMLSKLKKLSSH
jgi:alpha(1,3/1,4) fucosyltransferase